MESIELRDITFGDAYPQAENQLEITIEVSHCSDYGTPYTEEVYIYLTPEEQDKLIDFLLRKREQRNHESS